jgi:peptide deformylase
VVLEIVKFGHPVLREKGRPISEITPAIRQLSADMIETMYAANGVGLAAQQVARPVLLAVIDVRGSELPSTMHVDGELQDLAARMPLVLINPRVELLEGEIVEEEGCLSIPEVNAVVRRAASVRVEARTLENERLVFEAGGLFARAMQHELDHLQGILFVDRVDAATRASLAGRLKKLQKETQAALGPRPRRRFLARL